MGEKLNDETAAGGQQAGGAGTSATGTGTQPGTGTGTGTGAPPPTAAQGGGGSQADQSGPRERPTGSLLDDQGRPVRDWTTTEDGWTETTDRRYDPETGEETGSHGRARRTSEPGTASAEYTNPDGTTTRAYQAEHGTTKTTYDAEGNLISQDYEPREG